MSARKKDEPTDAEFLQAWARGDEAAGERLIKRYIGVLSRFFWPRVGHYTEDLVHDTLQVVIERRESMPGYCSFRAFLLGIARNKLHKHYRRQRVRRTDDLPECCDELPDRRTGLSTLLRRKDTNDVLAEAVLSLPLDQQLLIQLTYWERMSSQEVGEVLGGLPPTTVRSQRRVAEKALQQALEGRL